MLLTLTLALVLAQAPAPVASITVTTTATIDIDLGKVKGSRVRQLAWSPDGAELYLMTYDPNKDASVKKEHHTIIRLDTSAVKGVDAQPTWAVQYLTWKSAQGSPDDPSVKIDVAKERRREQAVATPFGGDLARGGSGDAGTTSAGGLSTEAAMASVNSLQMSDVYTMKLKGQTVGEWVNHPIVPGQTFGWAPKGHGLIAYADPKSGRLVLMNLAGDRQAIDGTKNVMVPAWSVDGTRLAYLEGRGRNKFALVVATVQK